MFRRDDPAEGKTHRSGSPLADNAISILNVAGPRKSKEPGVVIFVMQTLERAFKASK